MDTPTTGLPFHDIKKLLAVLHKLMNADNTLVVAEHNLDVIKSADWIIDLGPEGGTAGVWNWSRRMVALTSKRGTPLNSSSVFRYQALAFLQHGVDQLAV